MVPSLRWGMLFAILAIAGCLSAVCGEPDGGPQEARMRITRTLGDARSASDDQWPALKKQVLGRMQSRMEQQGRADAQTIASAIGEIGKVLDSVRKLSGDEFNAQRDDTVAKLMRITASGMGRGPAPGPADAGNDQGKPPKGGVDNPPPDPASGKRFQWIDVHNHLMVGPQPDYAGAVKVALAAMDQAGISKMIVMPTPGIGGKGGKVLNECDRFVEAIGKYPGRFAFLGGGATLNVMLHQAAQPAQVSDSLRRQFEQQAADILKAGAVGFGEIAIHHLSLHGSDHPYESVAADHPLLLLLADIAARSGVPIDVHFDVVTEDIPVPDALASPENPKTLRANLAAFERLLAHNRRARISWAHAGSDNVGHWTVDLSRTLLGKHPNLYMSLRMGPGHVPQNFALTRDGKIRQEWLDLFKEFPDRFVIGNDGFFASESFKGQGTAALLTQRTPPSRGNSQALLDSLPPDLARKIGFENAVALYKLKQ